VSERRQLPQRYFRKKKNLPCPDLISDRMARLIKHIAIIPTLLLLLSVSSVQADSSSRLTGTVIDPSDRPVPGAVILLRNTATLVEQTVTTNNEGIYELPELPVGTYRMQVTAPGFRLYTLEALSIDVARTVVQEVHLQLGEISDEVTVKSQFPAIDGATTSVGHVIDARTVQEMPLNGRYLLDVAALVPGSVTGSQTGFSTVPFRGLGTLAINTAGNREDTVNYVINGITLNDPLFNGINFQPSIDTLEEFKIDNSTLSTEYGQNSGAVVNVATKSGGSEFHGELFEFFRNDALDARNFFTLTSNKPPPFKRNQFGGHLGGPLIRRRTFFFLSYEGLRQEQNVNLNSVVLSDTERLSPGDAVIAKLIAVIPKANFVDSSGTSRFISSSSAPVNGDQWGIDMSHIIGKSDRLHGYYSAYRTKDLEPGIRGTTLPGFGSNITPLHQFFSLNEVHTFGRRTNELRIGVNRLSSATLPNALLNPADFGIRAGINQAIGLPQISIAGGALNFGGPSPVPSGSGRTVFVEGDTLSCLCGRHSLKIGIEFRQLLNNVFRLGTGAFNFPSVAAFLADNANSFSVTLGNQSSSTKQGALGLFVQSNYKWRPSVTLELGLRYEWNMTPSERYDRFIVFDPANASLERVGSNGKEVYHENTKNFEPRVGFAWDPFKNGKTLVRSAYAILVDQPTPYIVTGTAANPPLATPLAYSGPISFVNAIDLAQATGLAPTTVDHNYDNAYLQSWNFNVQRELARGIPLMVGYFGSKGTHLALQRNLNQPIDGVRPIPAVSLSSTILPGRILGNITQTESTGNSSYNALWVSASRRLGSGFQMNASYTWSKSLDYNSLTSMGNPIENAYNVRADRGPSDFDARQRFVASVLYSLPFTGKRFVKDWQVGMVLTAQSGSPVNIVTTNSTVTGVAGTLRPDVNGAIQMIGNVDHWFDTSAFTPVSTFGDLGRNVVTGPSFNNTDLSIMKNTVFKETIRIQFRAECFDALNHANLGQPGNVVGSPNFGRITNTRFPTGELGSSRQIQFGIKVIF
jgi:hypothetical protein